MCNSAIRYACSCTSVYIFFLFYVPVFLCLLSLLFFCIFFCTTYTSKLFYLVISAYTFVICSLKINHHIGHHVIELGTKCPRKRSKIHGDIFDDYDLAHCRRRYATLYAWPLTPMIERLLPIGSCDQTRTKLERNRTIRGQVIVHLVNVGTFYNPPP